MSGLSVPPEQMSLRARVYLIITAATHLLIGLACTLRSGDFDGDSFQIIRAIMPIWAWGLVFLAGGLLLTYAAVVATEGVARSGMSVSAVLTSLWAVGFIQAYGAGGVVSPVGAIIAASLTAKDLVICAQPMRSPFERLVKEYVGPAGSGRKG